MTNPTTVPIPRTVRRGDQGQCVSSAQGLLTAQGADPGPIDGIFGPKTEEVTKAFQAGHGLVEDGIIGPNTWTALIIC